MSEQISSSPEKEPETITFLGVSWKEKQKAYPWDLGRGLMDKVSAIIGENDRPGATLAGYLLEEEPALSAGDLVYKVVAAQKLLNSTFNRRSKKMPQELIEQYKTVAEALTGALGEINQLKAGLKFNPNYEKFARKVWGNGV